VEEHRRSLIGTWRLKSWESHGDDGTVTHPCGPDAVGYLTYTPDGFMFGMLTRANRQPFAENDLFGGTPEEWTVAGRGVVAYCGRYEVRSEAVIHHVELSLFPNWIGAEQVRFAELDGDRLTVRTAPITAEGRSVHLLVWERAR